MQFKHQFTSFVAVWVIPLISISSVKGNACEDIHLEDDQKSVDFCCSSPNVPLEQNCLPTALDCKTKSSGYVMNGRVYRCGKSFQRDLAFHSEGGLSGITEEPSNFDGNNYIEPNESTPTFLQEKLKPMKGGALISVGTSRVLSAATFGDFDRVIFFDFAYNIVAFNRLNLQLLRTISKMDLKPNHQRYQYLAALDCEWFSPGELEKIEKWEVTRKDPLVPERKHYKNCGSAHHLPTEVREIVSKIYGISHNPNRTRERPLYFPLHVNNDLTWKKLVSLIEKDRIQVVKGSVFGPHALASVVEALHKNGEEIKVVDISNIMAYGNIREKDAMSGGASRAVFEAWEKATIQFKANLSHGLFAKDALLIRTGETVYAAGDYFDQKKYTGGWSYSFVNLQTFLKTPMPKYDGH